VDERPTRGHRWRSRPVGHTSQAYPNYNGRVAAAAIKEMELDWTTLGVGSLMSAVVGLMFWLFLPRGVVLTRTPLSDIRDDTYGPVLDRWMLKNEASVPARITSVTLTTMSGSTTPRPDEEGPLYLDDEIDEITRVEKNTQWSQVTLAPSDALIAHVPNNQHLEIRYRRKGWSGVLERRQVTVRGVV